MTLLQSSIASARIGSNGGLRWPSDELARLRLHLIYVFRHGQILNLQEPRLFTELVQRRKLYGEHVRFSRFADKLLVKAHVSERLGKDWTIPTLWHGTDPSELIGMAPPIVIKSRHGSNQSIVLRNAPKDWRSVLATTSRWMAKPYGRWLDERLYAHIPRGLLVEPFIGTATRLPIDYKFYVFGGRVEFIQVHLGRETSHRWIIFDRLWRRVSAQSQDGDPRCPPHFGLMIEAAEELGRDFDFVRVDLYDEGARPLFGEMTFYPGSGLDPYDPISLDHDMGRLWLASLGSPDGHGTPI